VGDCALSIGSRQRPFNSGTASGDDYLYPSQLFRKLELPSDLQRALRMAS